MQTTLFNALNSIAYSAQQGTYNSGLPDQNAMSAVQDAYQNLLRQLGTTYDAAAASYTTTTVLEPQASEFSTTGISGSYDTQQQVASTLVIGGSTAGTTPNIRLIGG